MKHKKELMLLIVLTIFLSIVYSFSYIIPLVYAQDDWCYFPTLADKPCTQILSNTEIASEADCKAHSGEISYEGECTTGCCCIWKPVDKKYEQQTGTTKGYCNSLPSSVFNPSVSSPALCTNYCNSLTALSGDEGKLPACMNGIDDDNNGYIDDVHGWNVNQNNNNTNDEFGHGTIVSGIAAATSNNNLGMTGLAWKNSILPVRANVGSSGIFNYSDIAKAIVYADSFPTVKVINLSMGGYANSALLRDTIKNVLNNNKAVIVAGIGNDNIDIFNTPFYPAAYRGVIAVGAHANGLARVYSYGYPIQISAPGKDIYTTFLGGDYGYCSGTSCAAPFVSGVVALMASHFPDWTGKELNQGIKIWTDNPPDSSDYCYQPPMPSCLPGQACIQVMPDSVCERVDWTPQYGFGTLNGIMPLLAKCYDSSQELRTTIEIKSPDDRASFTRSQVVNIVGTVKSDNFINYKIEYGKGASPSAWISEGVALTGNGTQVVENGVLAQWNLSKITDSGYYQYRVRIYGKSSCNGNITGDERALLYIN